MKSGRRLSRLLLKGLLAAILLTLLLVLPLRWMPPLTSSFMVQNWWSQDGLWARVAYDWVPGTAISPLAARAVLAAEDQKYFAHAGFDMASIRKAWDGNARGRPVRGASTISQQVAKNLWLWPGRSWLRKGLEAWFTVWLELLLPKERILTIYLNIAQFGPHTFGVEAAAREYFGKAATGLNPEESARLAAVLPNPRTYSVRNPGRYVLDRQAWIQGQARRLDVAMRGRWPGRD